MALTPRLKNAFIGAIAGGVMGLSVSPLAALATDPKDDTAEQRIELALLGGLIGATACLLPARRHG